MIDRQTCYFPSQLPTYLATLATGVLSLHVPIPISELHKATALRNIRLGTFSLLGLWVRRQDATGCEEALQIGWRRSPIARSRPAPAHDTTSLGTVFVCAVADHGRSALGWKRAGNERYRPQRFACVPWCRSCRAAAPSGCCCGRLTAGRGNWGREHLKNETLRIEKKQLACFTMFCVCYFCAPSFF